MKRNFLPGKTYPLILMLIVAAAFMVIKPALGQGADRNQYPNLLVPDGENTFFADLGAWHAYSVPLSREQAGGFTGPYLIDSNKFCVSQNILRFIPVASGDTLIPASIEPVKSTYYPGRLEQSYNLAGFQFEHAIEFADNRSALISFSIKNTTSKSQKLEILWQGKLAGNLCFELIDNNIIVGLRDDGKKLITKPLGNFPFAFKLSGDHRKYSLGLKKPITLKPGQVAVYYFRQTYLIDHKDELHYKPVATVNPAAVYKSNLQRWNKYIARTLQNDSKWLKDEKYRRVAVKAIVTLITNWRSAAGDLLHDGITPSINLYDGFWAWDSWKHAAACAIFDPELGKSNIEAMFDYQDEKGMIADCIYLGKSENNLRDTKPPLAGWAVWEIFNSTHDTAFVKQMFPKLLKYHEWWYRYRDNDHNGLCEYGSTDGTRVAAAWESGMDNAVRYDEAVMVENGEGAWSLDQESVDLNSFLYREKLILAQMMGLLNDSRKNSYPDDAAKLKANINTLMFNSEKGFYFDIKLTGKTQIALMGSEGWHPLWAGVANQDQARKVSVVMSDPAKFNTYIPLPTFEADHKAFDPEKGYWRGPIWLDQVYFGIAGLQNYGFNQLADTMIDHTINRCEGMLATGPFCENYNPLSGAALQTRNFSWAAAHVLMLLCGK